MRDGPTADWRPAAHVLYQAAVDLWTNEGTNQSSRLNAFLVSNSIFLGLIGLAVVQTPSDRMIVVPLVAGVASIGGLWLSRIWYSVILRSVAYSRSYLASARATESLLTTVVDPQAEAVLHASMRTPLLAASTTGPITQGGLDYDGGLQHRLKLGGDMKLRWYEDSVTATYQVVRTLYGAVLAGSVFWILTAFVVAGVRILGVLEAWLVSLSALAR